MSLEVGQPSQPRRTVRAHAVVALLGLLWSGATWAGPAHVDRAVVLLNGACALDDAKLDLQKGGDGRLYLELLIGGALRARTSLVHSDVELFTDTTTKLQAQQPLEMSACMGRAVNLIIGSLLALPPDVAALPLAPPAGAGGNGGPARVPPVAPPSPVAVETAPAAVSMGPDGQLTFSIRGCLASGQEVICEVQGSNATKEDQKVSVHVKETMLYEANGSSYQLAGLRLGNQNQQWRSWYFTFPVIVNASPTINLVFRGIPAIVTVVQRLDVAIGVQTPNGLRQQKMSLAAIPIEGR